MALFRDVEGRFYEIPKDVLACHEVKKEQMDNEFGKKPVVGVQIPRPEAQLADTQNMGRFPGIVVNQYFGVTPEALGGAVESLPSDIEFAHYGTTVDNPKE
jgi:hypothetical protein